ncbi:MAG TPA: hypothetical protein VNL39_06275, partial [Xanthobacteraceae bacterium]|nr:hypothetical protein [Xanthobacteraceae bacterium]
MIGAADIWNLFHNAPWNANCHQHNHCFPPIFADCGFIGQGKNCGDDNHWYDFRSPWCQVNYHCDSHGNRCHDDDHGKHKGALKVEKDADVHCIDEGTPTDITFTYKLTNSNKHDPIKVLSLVDDNGTPWDKSDDINLLTDPRVQLVKSGGDQDNWLEKGEVWTYTITIEGVELDAGKFVNRVKVVGRDDDCQILCDTDKEKIKVKDLDPEINIAKLVDANGDKEFHESETVAAGTTDIVYRYVLTNESEASTDPLKIISLIDDNGTPTAGDDINVLVAGTFEGDDGDGLLEKGETWIYSVTRDDVELKNGDTLINTVKVNARDDECNFVCDSDSATVVASGDDLQPSIDIVKTASASSIEEGSTGVITYTYEVTNTSSAGDSDPLTIASIVDSELGDL